MAVIFVSGRNRWKPSRLQTTATSQDRFHSTSIGADLDSSGSIRGRPIATELRTYVYEAEVVMCPVQNARFALCINFERDLSTLSTK